jgi:hypothetical protein
VITVTCKNCGDKYLLPVVLGWPPCCPECDCTETVENLSGKPDQMSITDVAGTIDV